MDEAMKAAINSLERPPFPRRTDLQDFEVELDELMMAGLPERQRVIAWCAIDIEEDVDGNVTDTAVPQYIEIHLGDDVLYRKRAQVAPDVWDRVQEQATDQLHWGEE